MKEKESNKGKGWVVYILRCSDETLYTGITKNIEKRLFAHGQGTGAKYTRSRRPVTLIAATAKMKRTDAMHLERKIKKLPRKDKLSMLRSISKATSASRF